MEEYPTVQRIAILFDGVAGGAGAGDRSWCRRRPVADKGVSQPVTGDFGDDGMSIITIET